MAPYASIILVPDSPKYTIAEVNDAFLKLTYADRSIVDRGFFEAFPRNSDDSGERTSKLIQAFEYAIENKSAYNIPEHRYDLSTLDRHDIHYWSLDVFPMLSLDDDVKYIVLNITDITEVKQKEKELQVGNELFMYVNKATNDAIYDWDVVTNQIKWGDGFARMFGFYTVDGEFNIEEWASHVHAKDVENVRDNLESALGDARVKNWSFEYRFKRHDGSYAVVVENGYIIRDDAGKARRMIGVLRDISQIREIAWAQTHLVREPLTRIMGISKLLADRTIGLQTEEQLLTYLEASTDELDRVIKGIIDKSGERC